jgi:hypothetical protein
MALLEVVAAAAPPVAAFDDVLAPLVETKFEAWGAFVVFGAVDPEVPIDMPA